jgi:hypothetical protein
MKFLRLMRMPKIQAENLGGNLLRKTSAEYKIHAPDNIR